MDHDAANDALAEELAMRLALGDLRTALAKLPPERWKVEVDSVRNESGTAACFFAGAPGGYDRLAYIAAANPWVMRRLLEKLDRLRAAANP